MLPWIIAGVVIVGVVLLVVFIRRKKAREELKQYLYEHYGRWKGHSIGQLEEEISRIKSRKTELQHRLEAFGRAGPRIVLGSREPSPLGDSEYEMWHIRRQLEQLDVEEDDVMRVLRDKRTN